MIYVTFLRRADDDTQRYMRYFDIYEAIIICGARDIICFLFTSAFHARLFHDIIII